MRKDFYVFRHGETELNRENRWQGAGADYDINQTGVEQGNKLAEKLRNKKLDVIISSPLIRAKHTAQIAADKAGIGVVINENLRECFYGVAESQKIEDLKAKYPEIIGNWYNSEHMDIRFPGGESKSEALNRVWKVLEELSGEKYQTMGIAIHGGTMSAMLNRLGVKFEKLQNCAAFHLIYENGKWRVDGGVF